jgi:hypothetical protein
LANFLIFRNAAADVFHDARSVMTAPINEKAFCYPATVPHQYDNTSARPDDHSSASSTAGFMRHAVLRALLANPKIDFPLSHHGKHGIIYRQAIATK